jgi:hypothetical protein
MTDQELKQMREDINSIALVMQKVIQHSLPIDDFAQKELTLCQYLMSKIGKESE